METYLVVIGRTSTGYSAHCPDVLGCASVGKTVEQVIGNMKRALELHFEGMAEDGDPPPKARAVDSYRKLIKNLDVSQFFLGHVRIDNSRFEPVVRRLDLGAAEARRGTGAVRAASQERHRV